MKTLLYMMAMALGFIVGRAYQRGWQDALESDGCEDCTRVTMPRDDGTYRIATIEGRVH